jgi:hypothetical protein
VSCKFDLGLARSDLFFAVLLDTNSSRAPVGQITSQKLATKTLLLFLSAPTPPPEPGIPFTTHVVEWIPDSRSRGFRNDELLFFE